MCTKIGHILDDLYAQNRDYKRKKIRQFLGMEPVQLNGGYTFFELINSTLY